MEITYFRNTYFVGNINAIVGQWSILNGQTFDINWEVAKKMFKLREKYDRKFQTFITLISWRQNGPGRQTCLIKRGGWTINLRVVLFHKIQRLGSPFKGPDVLSWIFHRRWGWYTLPLRQGFNFSGRTEKLKYKNLCVRSVQW